MSLACKYVQCCFDCRCKRTRGNCTCNCLPWAGHPVLSVSIADVNYLSCKMSFRRTMLACVNSATAFICYEGQVKTFSLCGPTNSFLL